MSNAPENAAGLAELGARMTGVTPQAAAIGCRLVSVEAGEAAMAVDWREDLVGDPQTGVVAGGVVTTLLDQVCGLAVTSRLLADGRLRRVATLDLRIDYMRAAEPGRAIVAKARCYKLGHAIAFVRADAFDTDESDPVATAQAAFSIGPDVTAGG